MVLRWCWYECEHKLRYVELETQCDHVEYSPCVEARPFSLPEPTNTASLCLLPCGGGKCVSSSVVG